jgi:Spy/CpxP family protein refolding chaperone
MKNKNILSVFAALLLLTVAAAVYAHGAEDTSDSSDNSRWNMMGHMMSLEDMDEMHESMTEGLDPELKAQMAQMHEGCTSSFRRSGGSGWHDGLGSIMQMRRAGTGPLIIYLQ